MKPKTIYRMADCEVVHHPKLGFQLWHGPKGWPVYLVASFRTQRDAIRYLAREFVIPIQH